jgi:D-apionolactonase
MNTSSTTSPHVLQYGKSEPLPVRHHLQAGPLRLVYENGALRYLRLGQQEVVRMIYAAVRDHNWDTVPPRIIRESIEAEEKAFRVELEVEYRQADIHFRATYRIVGEETGRVRFALEGEALTSFRKNRLGFCVLHPVTGCAGRPCTITEAEGEQVQSSFPDYISPHQPFRNIQAMHWPVGEGVEATLSFEGDIFETEDQRNWTDASFKTYCTPLEKPFPVEVKQGEVVRQAVELSLAGVDRLAETGGEADATPAFRIDLSRSLRLPLLGVGQSGEVAELHEKEVALIRDLGLHHYRLEVRLEEPEWRGTFRQAVTEAAQLRLVLEVVLHLGLDLWEAELADFLQECAEAEPPLFSLLLLQRGRKSTSAALLEAVVPRLREALPEVRIGAGTNVYFTELNRDRPPHGLVDFFAFSLNPQVHAFDEASLIETLAAQQEVVASARQLSAGKPIHVSPVTLRPRFNPNATGPEPEPQPGELPAQVDVRQLSLYGAGWTLGSLKYLAEAGAASVTYYETAGRRGLLLPDTYLADAALFPAPAGAVFPVYAVLQAVLEMSGAEVLPGQSSDPLTFDGLVLKGEERLRVLLANYTAEEVAVEVQPLVGQAQVRLLTAETVADRQNWLSRFQQEPPVVVELQDQVLPLVLPPFAVAVVEVVKDK